MKASEVAKKAIKKMNCRITDEVFLLIQNDAELMQDYLLSVQEHGILQVNTTIGKEVRKAYSLENAPERQGEPRSTLIKSHQIFKG